MHPEKSDRKRHCKNPDSAQDQPILLWTTDLSSSSPGRWFCRWRSSLSLPALQARDTFYVSASSGRDSNDGRSSQSPWQSLDKVNAAAVRPGDRILFKRGDTWRGQLRPQSGQAGAPITYAAYGEVAGGLLGR